MFGLEKIIRKSEKKYEEKKKTKFTSKIRKITFLQKTQGKGKKKGGENSIGPCHFLLFQLFFFPHNAIIGSAFRSSTKTTTIEAPFSNSGESTTTTGTGEQLPF